MNTKSAVAVIRRNGRSDTGKFFLTLESRSENECIRDTLTLLFVPNTVTKEKLCCFWQHKSLTLHSKSCCRFLFENVIRRRIVITHQYVF